MQIGAMNHPACDPVGEIDWIGSHGFDFVDLTLEPPAAAPDRLDVAAVRAALDAHNLGVVAHTAYYLPLAFSLRMCCGQSVVLRGIEPRGRCWSDVPSLSDRWTWASLGPSRSRYSSHRS